jgi:hypothetical protein
VAGLDGIDGSNGVDGIDGVDGAASCTDCHSDTHREPIESSYPYSGHAAGAAVGYAGTRAGCAQCHSNEGYIDYMTHGATNPEGYANPTRIDCHTCHDKHGTFDFENDGYDYALRNFAPTILIVDPNYTIDFGDKSNTCASCHQPRTAPPTDIDGNGMFAVSSSHWGPHHGPQSTLLEGIQGAEIVGSEGYPGVASSTHRKESSCVECHMGEDSGNNDGLHSWIATSTACTSCHGNAVPEVEGLAADMEELGHLLEEVGIVHDGHPVVGDYTITQAEAAWNYLLIMEDSSNGIHNPAYAKALIKNSIEVLN